MKLFEQFAGVAMSEDGVRGQIIGRVHEVSLRSGRFSSSAYAGLRVADDAMIDLDQTRLKKRRKCEDD